jgi:hypothetical protein
LYYIWYNSMVMENPAGIDCTFFDAIPDCFDWQIHHHSP